MPSDDFTAHNRASQTITVKPTPVIVVKGLFALFDTDLRKMMSVKIFVDTAADMRFIRRLHITICKPKLVTKRPYHPVDNALFHL